MTALQQKLNQLNLATMSQHLDQISPVRSKLEQNQLVRVIE